MRKSIKSTLLPILIICLIIALLPYPLIMLIKHLNIALNKEDSTSPSFTLEEIPETISVYIDENSATETIEFEEYITGVVASEMPSEFELEALKAQSVAARTYSLAKVISARTSSNPTAHPEAPLCNTTHCQVYKDEKTLESQKGTAWMSSGYTKVVNAVKATEGQLLYYDGALVTQALFHSSSGGKTENCEDVFASAVPYLISVDSPYEDDATHQNETNTFTIDEFASKITSAYPNINFGTIKANNIKIASRSQGGRVENMTIGDGVVTGRSVRSALELPSANFTIDISDGKITFTSNGSGHGVGMSQYGANGMAKNGSTYKEILSHYYSGTEVY